MTKHLESLRVQNFRCLRDFTADRLGDVNLIVGKNNSGKSTVLEALYMYVHKSPIIALKNLASYRYEHDEKDVHINFIKSFFTYNSQDCRISVSGHFKKSDKGENVLLEYGILHEDKETKADGTIITKPIFTKLETLNSFPKSPHNYKFCIRYTNNDNVMHIVILGQEDENWVFNVSANEAFLNCFFNVNAMHYTDNTATDLSFLWDNVKHNVNYKKEILDILQTVDARIKDFDFYGTGQGSPKRTIKIMLDNYSDPVPLKSMGDGIIIIITYLIKALNAKDGVLLIDEIENGLHYSVQKQLWQVLFGLSKTLNIQIFATTHSWDTVESFAQVAKEEKEVEGVLLSMGRSLITNDIMATIYEEEELSNLVAKQREVR